MFGFSISVISRVSHHDCRVFNKAYNSLVINLATGPKAMAITIILPVKLGKLLAVSWVSLPLAVIVA